MKLERKKLFVKDMKLMTDFYKNVLQFEIKWDGKKANAEVSKDGISVSFYRRTNFKKLFFRKNQYIRGYNGHFEIAINVNNFFEVEKMYQETIKNGAKPVLEPITGTFGQCTCYIEDPEGNIVKIESFNK